MFSVFAAKHANRAKGILGSKVKIICTGRDLI
jgi:hypothetical protein